MNKQPTQNSDFNQTSENDPVLVYLLLLCFCIAGICYCVFNIIN